MKIAVLSVTQGEGHGAESVLVELMRAWVASETRDELFIVAPEQTRILRVAREVDLPHVAFASARDALFENLRGLGGVKDRFIDADIIHPWTARAFEFGSWFGRLSSARVSGTLHDHPEAFFHGRLRQKLVRYNANRMQGLVCVSEAVQGACNACDYRCPLRVIHNGLVDVAYPAVPGEQLRIGFLGMKARFKGFELIRPWMDSSAAAGAVWHLFGEADPALVKSLDGLPESAYVLHGRKDPESIYPFCDIIVHASDAFDSLPTVLIEAARAGLPSLASSLGGGPEIVRHGETGFVFSPDAPGEGLAKLLTLMEDAALREKLGRAARRHYETAFDVASMVAGYADFWRSPA
jgi:glycosyltransferase involved in cell wall biosynthesis